MKLLLMTVLALGTASFVAAYNNSLAFIAPGRADWVKRAPRNFGVFTPNCANAAGACNNACFYINCQAAQDPNANRVTYVGSGNSGEADKNRLESGCRFKNPPNGGTICRSYPFSQKFSPNAHDGSYTCDEWPPASSRQQVFSQKRVMNRNSLRCMPGPENSSLGVQLAQFYADSGNWPRRTIRGAMTDGDFFTVDFSINTQNSPYCNAPQRNQCDNDGFQFGMTSKTVDNGKVGSPYTYTVQERQNRYALQQSPLADLVQCSIKFERNGDDSIAYVVLTNFNNIDVKGLDCRMISNGQSCTYSNLLPNDLKITRTGPYDTPFDFTYADSTNPNYIRWNSATIGPGKGPGTNAGTSNTWCTKVDLAPTIQSIECWFPCRVKANGLP